jgi:hypothetical protein
MGAFTDQNRYSRAFIFRERLKEKEEYLLLRSHFSKSPNRGRFVSICWVMMNSKRRYAIMI